MPGSPRTPKTYIRGLLDAADIAMEMHRLGCSPANVASHLRSKAANEQRQKETAASGASLENRLEELIARLEDGENHNAGAFDSTCPTCLVLRELRGYLGGGE